MKQNAKKQNRMITLSTIDRVCMFTLTFVQYFLFLYFVIMMVHYVYQPIPWLFSSPSLLDSQYKQPHYLYNGALYILFFCQHVVMALLGFKIKMAGLCQKYPLYERFIFNLSASIVFIIILHFVKPVSNLSTQVFRIPQLICPIILIPYTIVLAISFLQLGQGIFHPYSLNQILYSKAVQPQNYTQNSKQKLTNKWLYSYMRHPMVGSMLILMLFSSNIYTMDRIIFLAVMIVGVMIGIISQQKKLRKKHHDYIEYQKIVKSRFVPYLL